MRQLLQKKRAILHHNPACLASPTGSHVTKVDRNNHETCRYCPYERQNPIEDLQPIHFFNSAHIYPPGRETELAVQAQLSRLAREWE